MVQCVFGNCNAIFGYRSRCYLLIRSSITFMAPLSKFTHLWQSYTFFHTSSPKCANYVITQDCWHLTIFSPNSKQWLLSWQSQEFLYLVTRQWPLDSCRRLLTGPGGVLLSNFVDFGSAEPLNLCRVFNQVFLRNGRHRFAVHFAVVVEQIDRVGELFDHALAASVRISLQTPVPLGQLVFHVDVAQQGVVSDKVALAVGRV